jgi:ComEC/Rec2-related protein
VLAWLLWEGAAGRLRLDLPHLLGAGLLGASWLLLRRLYSPALLALALLAPLLLHFAWQLPAASRALTGDAGYLRLEGTVRGRWSAGGAQTGGARLLLGEAVLWRAGERLPLAELEVVLPRESVWRFPYRGRVRIGGRLAAAPAHPADRPERRLRLTFGEAAHHLRTPLPGFWEGETLRLRDRAAYYLSPRALAVYLPILLGLRERTTPEARAVAGTFRRVGIAHLFAISGLHVGLLFVLLGGIVGSVQGLWAEHAGRGQGWAHARAATRVGVVAAIWLYIALIGFPIPAVRAALMGTMLVWTGLWGTRSPPVYVLCLAGGVLLVVAPSQIYDLSFQLSFLAYFFLLCALALFRPLRVPREVAPWRRRLTLVADGCRLNLWMTLLITLGLWPLATATFGQLSLLVFAGNLVMIPLLGLAALPLGLAAFLASLAHLQAAPGGWTERLAFGALDATLRAWVWLAELLDALGGALVIRWRSDMEPRAYLLYYALLLLLIWGLLRWRRSRRKAPQVPPA